MDSTFNYYSDPTFTVFRVPKWRAFFYTFLSLKVWGNLPSSIQRKISAWYCKIYTAKWSKHLIRPYIRLNYKDEAYLSKFKPPSGKAIFENFQDFFTRQFRNLPENTHETVWPCEGLLCEEGKVNSITLTNIKQDVRTVETVFGVAQGTIPKNYSFSNVFLHNKNYHRIHAPVTGTITRIQHIPGDLVVLRPWIYPQNPSLPAFRNERINVDIIDANGAIWYMSIVGGPAVGTIELNDKIRLGVQINKLDELAVFLLGSTCCMATPIAPKYHTANCFVEVGQSF